MPDRPQTGETRRPVLSVIIPCFDEEAVIEDCARRLTEELDRLDLSWELLFVDDGSRDGTADKLRALTSAEPRFRAIILSRNFGQPVAVFAGLDNCIGDAAIVMDADLQDPPSVIADMVSAWREGSDIVVGERRIRRGAGLWRRAATAFFSRIMGRLTDRPLSGAEGDFRLMDRKVIDAVRRMRERPRLLRAASSWVGFKVAVVPFERAERHAGRSHYSGRRLLELGFDTLIAFSNRPLRIAGWLAAVAMIAAIAGLFYAVGTRVAAGAWPDGWLLLLFFNLFLVGVQLAVLALIGSYLGRIYDEVKGRPAYIVAEQLNDPADRSAANPRPARPE